VDNLNGLTYFVISMGIPYQAIGIGIGFIIGIWTLMIAETTGGRIFILTMMIVIFFLPIVWRHPIASILSFVGWIAFAIGCYIYIRWQNVKIG